MIPAWEHALRQCYDSIPKKHGQFRNTITFDHKTSSKHTILWRVLESTGGALAWGKCTAYIQFFEWVNGIKKMINTKDTQPPLEIKSLMIDVLQKIKLANPFEAFRMLGAYVAPDGNTKEQVEVLTKIAKKWANSPLIIPARG